MSAAAPAHFALPFGFAPGGRTATAGDQDHLRGLIMAVLFTAPGERVNRPDFGCGLKQLVFAPLDEMLASATQQMIQGALLRWLGDVIHVETVAVTAENATLAVRIDYVVRATSQRQSAVFRRAIAS